MSFVPVIIILIALLASFLLGYTPLLIPIIYFVLGLFTFFLYAKDKRAAKNGDWRVSEGTLHFFSLFCGWPGAIIAQQKLRHKTRKTKFRLAFWLTVLANSAGLVWIHTGQGAAQFRLLTSNIEVVILSEVANSSIRSNLLYLLKFHAYL